MDTQHSPRTVIAAFGVLALAVAVGAILLLTTRPAPVEIVINPPVPTATAPPSATPGPLLIYVTGAVHNPHQTLELPPGSRVRDAIDAAGGFTDDADLERVNVAGALRDGDHVHVFAHGEPESAALPTPGGGGIVAINSATRAELESLPGIGPALAQRIIDYRDAHGPFADLAALEDVSGIGPVILERIADLVTFD